MEQSSIILLYQLVNAYSKFYADIKSGFEEQNKEKLDIAASKLLEISKKINALIT